MLPAWSDSWPVRTFTREVGTAFQDTHNNHAERGLRGVVLGRKNHYGSKSKRGTEVAAIFYALFETAKLAGVEPKTYLMKAIRAALELPETATLPHAL